MDAVKAPEDESNDILNCKIAEYSKAVLDGRPHFHINLVIDESLFADGYLLLKKGKKTFLKIVLD